MIRTRSLMIALAGVGAAVTASIAPAQPPTDSASRGEWRTYGSDPLGSRYSPLDQIQAENFKDLKVAWRWYSPDNTLLKRRPDLKAGPNEGTPIMVEGVLYVPTSLNQVCAIEAATGKTLWTFNPESFGYVHRGVSYWEGTGRDGKRDRRIFHAASDFRLYSLDAGTGKPVRSFGDGGAVDLSKDLRRPVARKLMYVSSPPMICGNVVVVGSSVDDFQDRKEMPPGDVRGFDARTGKLVWTFHTVPQVGETGNDTWKDGSWRYTGNTNVWAPMSYDPELNYIYLPVSTPTNDWYGGHRKGDGLFGESIVCLDARTGKRVWHYQFVHHGVWDYDPPCAPNLLDVTLNGKKVKAVAQVTKQAFCFVFDRVTGKPLWPIQERPVPQSRIPGEETSPTQPFPTRPAPFDRQGLTDADLIDFTPELKQEARKILEEYNYGPLYTPPVVGRKSIESPGWVGGASWAGAAVDPERGWLYVPSVTNPMWLTLKKPKSFLADVDYKLEESGDHVEGPRGLPITRPPYGRITAIDLNTGDHRWMAIHGDGPRDHPALRALGLPPLGRNRRGYCVVTKTLLITAQEGSWFGNDIPEETPRIRAFDKATGKLLQEVRSPAPASGAPITYMARGRQYVVIPIGGSIAPQELVAFALPADGAGRK